MNGPNALLIFCGWWCTLGPRASVLGHAEWQRQKIFRYCHPWRQRSSSRVAAGWCPQVFSDCSFCLVLLCYNQIKSNFICVALVIHKMQHKVRYMLKGDKKNSYCHGSDTVMCYTSMSAFNFGSIWECIQVSGPKYHSLPTFCWVLASVRWPSMKPHVSSIIGLDLFHGHIDEKGKKNNQAFISSRVSDPFFKNLYWQLSCKDPRVVTNRKGYLCTIRFHLFCNVHQQL